MAAMPSYFIRTYGCQMNEHDSERIAGLLDAEGYARADSPGPRIDAGFEK